MARLRSLEPQFRVRQSHSRREDILSGARSRHLERVEKAIEEEWSICLRRLLAVVCYSCRVALWESESQSASLQAP